MGVYAHTHIRTYTHTHIHTYTHTHIHTYTHTHIYSFSHFYIYTFSHIHIYTYTHLHIYTCTHIHIYTCTHVYMYTYTQRYIYTYKHIHMYTYTHCHIFHISTDIHIHIHIYTHTLPPPRLFLKAMKLPEAKVAVDQACDKLHRKIPAREEATVKSNSEVTRDAKKMQTGTLCNTDGFMSFQNFANGKDSPNIQRTGFAQSTTMFLTEQGASGSDMTAAKVLDAISRLPGCSGQASHAVSAFAPVEMTDAPLTASTS